MTLTIPRSSGTRHMRHDAWSDEHVETVRTMWAAGYSARQIGNAVPPPAAQAIAEYHSATPWRGAASRSCSWPGTPTGSAGSPTS